MKCIIHADVERRCREESLLPGRRIERLTTFADMLL